MSFVLTVGRDSRGGDIGKPTEVADRHQQPKSQSNPQMELVFKLKVPYVQEQCACL